MVPVFIEFMTPAGASCSRNQKRILRPKCSHAVYVLGKKRQNITAFLLAVHPKIYCVLKFDKWRAAEYKQVTQRATIADLTAIIITDFSR